MMDIILLRFSKLFSNQEHQDKSRGASFEAGVRGLRSPAGLPALPGSPVCAAPCECPRTPLPSRAFSWDPG